MININIDNLNAFYIVMAIITLAFAIMVTFGKTEDSKRNSKKTTTTS
jgi:hypothetical protein